MTSTMMRKLLSGALALMLSIQLSSAQVLTVENALFWEITGPELESPSYIFGSHHLLGSQSVDTLFNVLDKFYDAEAFMCEVLFDSTQTLKMMQASIMMDSTLDQVLPPEWYAATEQWLSELSHYENLAALNNLNPQTIQLILENLLHLHHYGEIGIPMDIYLQQKAKDEGKPRIGLETIDEQLHVLYQSSYKQQAEQLIEMVANRDSALTELINTTDLYFSQDLHTLLVIAEEKYKSSELDKILFDRNTRWIRTIAQSVREQSTFIMVGALHLAGDRGIISQLRALGFTLAPIPLEMP